MLFDVLSEVSENGIVVDGNGDTLAALFSGQFKLPEKKTKKLTRLLREWEEDEEGNVDGPSGKRSQILGDGTEVYVSGVVFDVFVETQISDRDDPRICERVKLNDWNAYVTIFL